MSANAYHYLANHLATYPVVNMTVGTNLRTVHCVSMSDRKWSCQEFNLLKLIFILRFNITHGDTNSDPRRFASLCETSGGKRKEY